MLELALPLVHSQNKGDWLHILYRLSKYAEKSFSAYLLSLLLISFLSNFPLPGIVR